MNDASHLAKVSRSLSLLVLLILTATATFAQEGSTQKSEAAPNVPAAADVTKPGPEQAFLARRAGEYTRTVKFVAQPNADANASTGTAKISVTLDGRFIVEENTDTVFGRPVSGTRIYGYNKITKQMKPCGCTPCPPPCCFSAA